MILFHYSYIIVFVVPINYYFLLVSMEGIPSAHGFYPSRKTFRRIVICPRSTTLTKFRLTKGPCFWGSERHPCLTWNPMGELIRKILSSKKTALILKNSKKTPVILKNSSMRKKQIDKAKEFMRTSRVRHLGCQAAERECWDRFAWIGDDIWRAAGKQVSADCKGKFGTLWQALKGWRLRKTTHVYVILVGTGCKSRKPSTCLPLLQGILWKRNQ